MSEAVASEAGTNDSNYAQAQQQLVWKKNARQLYDTILAFELPWPSLTVQFLPEVVTKEKKTAESTNPATKTGTALQSKQLTSQNKSSIQRMLLATNTGGQATEYLRVGELTIPQTSIPRSLAEYDAEQGIIGGFHPDMTADLRLVQRIQVNGVIMRLRYMPQNPNVVASISGTGETAIWDCTKFPYKPLNYYVPTTKLLGHEGTGVCLDWSPCSHSELASGDTEGKICLWNMRAEYNSSTGEMNSVDQRNHTAGTAINDLQWHPRRQGFLASIGDDGWLHVHNTTSKNAPAFISHHFGDLKPTALAWNPVNDSLMAVAFECGKVQLWDLRSTPTLIYSIDNAHSDYVTKLAWNTWHPAIFASASVDRTIKIWNAAAMVQTPLFVHAGHTAAVTDISWNPADAGVLASVSEDNSLHVFRPADDILGF